MDKPNEPDTQPIDEDEALRSFLKKVEDIRGSDSDTPLSPKTAMKFLIARKFDVNRTVELYKAHEITRHKGSLSSIDPNDNELRKELNSGKFTILNRRGPNNCAIALFTAKLHVPVKSRNSEMRQKLHRRTLQGIVYQLDAALEDVDTQRNGIVFIYNMGDSDYSNFDFDLCQKIMNLLKGAYPAKLKKVLIVSPPLWFRAPFHLLRLIVREKLRDRVYLLNKDAVSTYVPRDTLPSELGGQYSHDHQEWLEKCAEIHESGPQDFCDPVAAQKLINEITSRGSGLRRLSSEIISHVNLVNHDNNNSTEQNRNQSTQEDGPNRPDKRMRCSDSEFDYDDRGYSLADFVRKFQQQGKAGLNAEYEVLRCKNRPGSTRVADLHFNNHKNRYMNILPYDHTRVILKSYDLAEGYINNSDPGDYINACHIDGYRQPKAYISTQGPLMSTCMDFWRMIWQSNSRVIVMFALIIENGQVKCHQYWPTSDDPTMVEGNYKIEFEDTDWHEDFNVTRLKLTNIKTNESRCVWHLQYTSWPDFGTPTTASALLKFREFVLKKQLDAIEATNNICYPPLVVHCSAGVGRTGTFITIDISIQKLETTGLVDIENVVDKLRYQRRDSIQTADQYVFCYMALLEYAVDCGILSGEDSLESLIRTDN